MSYRINTLARRPGIAAAVGGVLFALSFGVELVYAVSTPDGVVNNMPVAVTYAALWALAFISLAFALVALRSLDRAAGGLFKRPGRVGIWLALAGSAVHIVFAGQVITSIVTAREIPEVFALWALGMLLMLVGLILVAIGLRAGGSRRVWITPLISTAGILLAASPLHDFGLFMFAAGWIAMGVTMVARGPGMRVAPA